MMTSTIILDGKKISEELKQEIKKECILLQKEKNIKPGLTFILVGNNPASESYVKMKNKACEEIGFYSITEKLPENVNPDQLIDLIKKYNNDEKIHGILIQLPLPEHLNPDQIIETIDYRKDVDGFHPVNIGKLVIGQECLKPCTPAGIQELLKRYDIKTSGKHIVILGRSNIVGKPAAIMFLQKQEWANAIVTVVHSAVNNIHAFTRQADILICAMGKPQSIHADMIKKGAVVIDVGINRIPDTKNKYKIVGDVHFESVSRIASAITPVPGGVGPMTVAMLLSNTLKACKRLTNEHNKV